MEDVAKEAGVAKGTVYLAFDSKEALFAAVVADVCEEIERRVAEAVEGVADPLARVRARLDAKYVFLHDLVSASPHAAELLETSDQVAARAVRDLDDRFRRELASDLTVAQEAKLIDLDAAKLESSAAASLLMRAARSCSLADEGREPPSTSTMRKRLFQATDLLLRGLK